MSLCSSGAGSACRVGSIGGAFGFTVLCLRLHFMPINRLLPSRIPMETSHQAERLFRPISATFSSDYARLSSLLDFASSLVESMEKLRSDPTIISLSSATPTALMGSLATLVRIEIAAQHAMLCETHGDLGPFSSVSCRMPALLTSLDMYSKK